MWILQSHKKALLAEQESLLSMMEQAESIEDIIAINEQLTDVRYQIESMESQLRTYDNQVDYSTVNLYIDEVERYHARSGKERGCANCRGLFCKYLQGWKLFQKIPQLNLLFSCRS